jgi:hypothetical protein
MKQSRTLKEIIRKNWKNGYFRKGNGKQETRKAGIFRPVKGKANAKRNVQSMTSTFSRSKRLDNKDSHSLKGKDNQA